MVSKRKATVEITVSPVKKAASNRKRKVVDIVEVPEEEEDIKVKGKGSKTRNTRTNAAVEIGFDQLILLPYSIAHNYFLFL